MKSMGQVANMWSKVWLEKRLEPWAPKKNNIGTEKRRYLRPDSLVIGQPMQKAIKSKDHSWVRRTWDLF